MFRCHNDNTIDNREITIPELFHNIVSQEIRMQSLNDALKSDNGVVTNINFTYSSEAANSIVLSQGQYVTVNLDTLELLTTTNLCSCSLIIIYSPDDNILFAHNSQKGEVEYSYCDFYPSFNKDNSLLIYAVRKLQEDNFKEINSLITKCGYKNENIAVIDGFDDAKIYKNLYLDFN